MEQDISGMTPLLASVYPSDYKNNEAMKQTHTHLLYECVVVGLNVNVDGGVRKGIENVSEKRDTFVVSSLTKTLCTDKDKSNKHSLTLT